VKSTAIAFLATAAFAYAPAVAQADQGASPGYAQAVAGAYAIVSTAQPGDVAAAQHATAVLEGGTGTAQPEIIADLAKRPPDFTDAAARLAAVQRALEHPASTADPSGAQAKLHDVLSQNRYDALHRPPTPLERLQQWLGDRLRDLLRYLFGGNGNVGGVPNWVIYLVGALIIAAVGVVVFRSAGGQLGGRGEVGLPGGPRAPSDYFAEADRLAARGERVGAVRALCAAVAGTISGQQTWEGSPLTVREIFSRSSDPAALRPLLIPFEAAVYGGRDVDAASYERALAAAAPFRSQVEVAAA
jgi:hypothetical protein